MTTCENGISFCIAILSPFKPGSMWICDDFEYLWQKAASARVRSITHRIILPFSNSIRSSAKGVSLLCCGWDVFSEFRSAFVGVESLQPQEADCSLPFPSA